MTERDGAKAGVVVHLTIDGQEVSVPAGSTVYEAATSAGVHIPTFCHHDKLVPVGACRMCLVEIEGARGLQTSCTTPVREDMIVKVHSSPTAVKARKANIEFLLTNHPLDCPVCDKGGECPLQDQALLDGPGQSRYVEEKRLKNKRYPLGDLIVLDQERCVLCWRCIRFLDEWAGDHELDLFGRGADTRIDTFPGQPLRSKWQGNTIDICPVGALTSHVFRFEARVWELTNTPSVCPLCSMGCNIELGVKNNRVRRITPRENMQVNDAWICDKGRFAHAFVDHPDRLQVPLVRRDGQLQPASWEEALDLVAARFDQVVRDHGPQAIGGLGSTRVTNEASYLFQRFMRTVLGSNSVDHLGRMPAKAAPLGSLPDLEFRDVILLLGCDPSVEAPLLELWLKKAVLRHGATIVVVNPRRIELCRYDRQPDAPAWLGYRPGSELVLMNGLLRAILEAEMEGQAVRAGSVGSDLPAREDLAAWLQPYGPQQVERISGVPARALQHAAQLLAQAVQPVILYGPAWVFGPSMDPADGSPRDSGGRAKLDAVSNLALLLAGIARHSVEAGFVPKDNNTLGALEMGVAPDLCPGGFPLTDNRVRSRLASFWGGRLSPVEGLDFDGMMRAGREDGLKAMWVMGADPAHDCREAGDVLGRIPFLVVQELFMTETASLAEVVLPAASFAESDGCFTNLTGRLQAIRAAKRPPGQARPDWWIITELARRMVDDRRQRAWGFASPADVLSEISKVLPGYRGVDYATMDNGGWQRPAAERTAPHGNVRDLLSARAPVRVDPHPQPPDPEYPLTLVTGQLLYDRGTLLRCSGRIQNLVPDAFVMIHPAEAEKLDLADGDQVLVVSPHGQLAFAVRVSDEVVPGAVFAPLNLSDAPLSVLFADRWTLPRVRIVK
jgi:NADH-quinone oxidoreductase chain G